MKIEQIDLAELNELPDINAKGGFAASEAYAWHKDLIARRHNDYDQLVAPRILRGKDMSAADYIELLGKRADLQRRVSAITANYDAVIMPTCAIVAPTLDEVSTSDGFTKKNMLLLRNTTVGNFLDRCGISLPCHAAGELPVGFMLMGEAMADRRVLAMARSVAPVVSQPRWISGDRRRAAHAPDILGRGVFAVAQARDRLEGHDVDPSVLEDGVVDVHADHMAQHDRAALFFVALLDRQLDGLPVLAFQRHRRFLDPRRLYEAARLGRQARRASSRRRRSPPSPW